MKRTIYIGADHAGFDLKSIVSEHLRARGYEVEDLGAHELDPHDDYPDYAGAVAEAVAGNPGSFGVLSCGNAEGVCIAANKFDGVRAGLGYSREAASTMRTDDNANIICLPGRVKTADDPLRILDTFLATDFSGAERHRRRLEQVEMIEALDQTEVQIVPAVLAQTEADFVAKLANVELQRLAPLFQVDILDGSIFEASSYADPQVAASLRDLPELELHLMIEDPLPTIECWHHFCPNKLSRAIVHFEITAPIIPIIEAIKKLKLEVGLAINPETQLTAVEHLLPTLDLLLVMGVHPGQSGQQFLGEQILQKLTAARELSPVINLAVDGGVTIQNAAAIVRAGADQLCVASALLNAENQKAAFLRLAHAG